MAPRRRRTCTNARIAEIWADAFGGIRAETVEAKRVVAAHPRGGLLLNFCPGLAEVLTGSSARVPAEMERIAEVLDSTL